MMSFPSVQRIWLPCSAQAVDAELDLLCAWLRRRPIAFGYLSARAPLLSNLTVMENLWLPHAWRWGCSRELLFQRLRLLAPGVVDPGGSEPSCRPLSAWLHARPAELSPDEVAYAVVLRAALGRPQVVVVDPSWLAWSLASALLQAATWWLPSPEPGPMMSDQPWISMNSEEACKLLM